MKLKSNVWIRQPDPVSEPERPVSSQSVDASVYCYFTNHGLKAGYAGEEVEGTRAPRHPRHPPPSSLSRDMRDTVEREIEKERIRERIIEREIEKERIREQVIMSEITKRRALEDEIRYELMLLENELARRRKSKALLHGLPPAYDPMEISVTGTVAQKRPVDERTVFCPQEETVSNVLRRASQGSETFPFKRGDEDPKGSEVQPVPVAEKSKENEEKLVLLAKCDASISGSKRKAVTPTLADTNICASVNISNKKAKDVTPSLADTSVFASENISNKKAKAVTPPLADTSICASDNISNKKDKAVPLPVADTDNIPNKKSEGEWSFDLRQVIAPTGSNLSFQLQGNKHKMNEASLKSQCAGKNYDVGLLRKSHSLEKEIAAGSLLLEKKEDLSVKRNKGLPQLLKPNTVNKKEETVQKLQKNDDPNKTNNRYWCELCEVRGSLKIKYSHENGKKHLNRLKRSRNIFTWTRNTEKRLEVHATCFQEVAKGSVELTSNVEVNKRNETGENNVDVIKPGYKMNYGSDSIEDGEIVG